jgi:hypothetical protein
MPSTSQRWRKGSVFCCTFRPLDRNDLARLLFLAEALDRRTHRPGKHGGIIGRTGLAVLRALVTRFFNKASGRLDPSIEAIAKAANVARSTAQAALDRLELVGLIERVRRIARVRVAEFCPWSGTPKLVDRVRQISNGYLLNVPIPNRKEETDFGRSSRRKSSDTGRRSETTHIYNPREGQADSSTQNGVAEALERLRQAREASLGRI